MPDEDNIDSLLSEAVRFGDLDKVRYLLDDGFDSFVNRMDIFQWSPIHEAACNGRDDILKVLVDHGADVNLPDTLKGFTPLHYAAEEDHMACMKLLLSTGAQMNSLSHDGRSVLDVSTGSSAHYLNRKAPLYLKCDTPSDRQSPQLHELVNMSSSRSRDTSPMTAEGSRTNSESPASGSDQSINKTPSLGYAEISFEYNAKRNVLKVRVWKIGGLLMPAVESSKVSGVQVKGALVTIPQMSKPNTRPSNETHKKIKLKELHSSTELLPAYALKTSDPDSSVSKATEETTYMFAEPLHFKDVGEERVREESSSFRLRFCVRQKWIGRLVKVSELQLPLREAVRKLARERIPLRPCVSSSDPAALPMSMRVYGWHEEGPSADDRSCMSQPNLRPERPVLVGGGRTLSDPHLRVVGERRKPRSTVIAIDTLGDETIESEFPSIKVIGPQDDEPAILPIVHVHRPTSMGHIQEEMKDDEEEFQVIVHSSENMEQFDEPMRSVTDCTVDLSETTEPIYKTHTKPMKSTLRVHKIGQSKAHDVETGLSHVDQSHSSEDEDDISDVEDISRIV